MSQQLNLPKADIKLFHDDGKTQVWDIIRRKYVQLTPEEWVRQHFVHYLINHFGYPRSLMKVEAGLKVNKMSKRSDLVILGRDGMPWMLIECKSPYVSLGQETLIQAINYNRTYQASYVVLANGMEQIICNVTNNRMEVIHELPPYPINS